jgi:hypothetical protein
MKNGIEKMEKNAAEIALLTDGRDQYEDLKARLQAFANGDHEIQIIIKCVHCGTGQVYRIGEDTEAGSKKTAEKMNAPFMFTNYEENAASFKRLFTELANSCDTPIAAINEKLENLIN